VYKQFLEILQLYQRDSKPIQDVYAQVTQLFRGAQDLLDDFKQFLPESAAAAQKQAREMEQPMTSNLRGEANYRQAQTPRPESKMPPMGNFAPSSVTKDPKKRPRPSDKVATGQGSQVERERNMQQGPASKRPKVAPTKTIAQEVIPSTPNLVPDLPHPLPPIPSTSTIDEFAWFERCKKFIGNKTTFNEMLKLLNLFTMDLIDKNQLIDQMAGFIGHSVDLFNFVKKWVNYTGKDQIIENKPVMPSTKVSLSNCRGYGPSYRLLPKRERLAKCSGRDEMCYEVLNDEWASHPTWASEDSGFVAHRKNAHEEALHRMEEERHDYDFNIETALRTIQLLEPIVNQINSMSPETKESYRLPHGLGGQSETIWQRVIKKLYDRSTGQKIIDDMMVRPAKVAPFLLVRLKEKVEKWKQAQREWEKIWRDQTHKQFWKSLDHQGLSAKADNKRLYQPKALQTEIMAKFEEQKQFRIKRTGQKVPHHQLDYPIHNVEVIYDACRLLVMHLHTSGNADSERIEAFLLQFLSSMFGLDHAAFKARMADIKIDSPPNEEADDEPSGTEEVVSRGRGRGGKRADTQSMRKRVLTGGKQGNNRSDSKESTPAAESAEEDSSADTPSEQTDKMDISKETWVNWNQGSDSAPKPDSNTPFTRSTFKLYANSNIFYFVRCFQMIYERLWNIKEWEVFAAENVRRAMEPKPAILMAIAEKSPTEYFEDVSSKAQYYPQILKLTEEMLKGNVETPQFEDCLRRYYLYHGWQLYGFDKMLAAANKYALQILNNDNKERSNEMINLFYKNRREVETTPQNEINYRKQVEKLAKDGDLYKVTWLDNQRRLTVQIFKKSDPTLDLDEATAHERWTFYVTSYNGLDWTEGVPSDGLRWPFVRRNVPEEAENADSSSIAYHVDSEENLAISFAEDSYHLNYDKEVPGRLEYHVQNDIVRRRLPQGEKVPKIQDRIRGFEDKMVQRSKEQTGGDEALYDKSVQWSILTTGEAPKAQATPVAPVPNEEISVTQQGASEPIGANDVEQRETVAMTQSEQKEDEDTPMEG